MPPGGNVVPGSHQERAELGFGDWRTGDDAGAGTLGVLPVADEVQRLNLLECRVIERESA